MKVKIRRVVEEEIDIAAVRLVLPVYYGEEDMPADFPGREGDTWTAVVDLPPEGAFIRDWPHRAVGFELAMKVTDGGSYHLISPAGEVIASIEQDYVPHGVVPGKYGDYVHLAIQADGRVANWPKVLDLTRFFPCEESP